LKAGKKKGQDFDVRAGKTRPW